MFCNKCGKEVSDGALFCGNCGQSFVSVATPTSQQNTYQQSEGNQAQQGGYQAPQGGYQAPQGGYQAPQGGYQPQQAGAYQQAGGYQQNVRMRKKKMHPGVLAAIALVVIVAIWALTGESRGAKTPESMVYNLVEAKYEMNENKLKRYINEDVLDGLVTTYGIRNEADLFETMDLEYQMEDKIEDVVYMIEVDEEDIMKYMSVITEEREPITGEEFRYISENYKEYTGVRIKEACKIYCSVKFEHHGYTEMQSDYIHFVKIGSRWYPDIFDGF